MNRKQTQPAVGRKPALAAPAAAPCASAKPAATEGTTKTPVAPNDDSQLAAIYDCVPIMMCLLNEKHEVELMNRAMAEFVAKPINRPSFAPLAAATDLSPAPAVPNPVCQAGDLVGCFNSFAKPEGCGFGPRCQACPLREALNSTFLTGKAHHQLEVPLLVSRNGHWRETQVMASTNLLKTDGRSRVLLCLEDVTNRKQLETQLIQAQKMEAIGQLAGGVAHDFNNILTATMMGLEVLRNVAPSTPEVQALLTELQNGADRGASLTRQLLLFSRRQVMQTRRLDVKEITERMLTMLRRLLGEQIEITWVTPAQPAWVMADAGMLEQVIMNLCVNARDAMPSGGKLTLTCEPLQLSNPPARPHPDARAGQFVRLSVADTGLGMDEPTLKRIFEPFFTTKEQGKGTGLGLATVYGIVKQHQGWIEVESSVNAGATFHVYLPLNSREIANEAPGRQPVPRGGREGVLIVEDDTALRRHLRLSLEARGYRVVEAKDGQDAVRVWKDHSATLDLVLTDMILPGNMTGLKLLEELRRQKPGLKALLSSGYSLEFSPPADQAGNPIHFLPKPYQPEALAKAVRDCLDGKPARAPLARGPRKPRSRRIPCE